VPEDGNFWFGGATGVGGIAARYAPNRLTLWRHGFAAFGPTPVGKASYNNGDYFRFGGTYQSVAVPGNTPGLVGLTRALRPRTIVGGGGGTKASRQINLSVDDRTERLLTLR
jgi:hypothetical protein